MNIKLAHLYALLVGVVVQIAGWFLVFYVTGHQARRFPDFCPEERDPIDFRNCFEYGYRIYGVAVIVVSLIFIVLVIRDAKKQRPQ